MSKINKSISGVILILLTSFVFSFFYFGSLILVVAWDLNVERFLFEFFALVFVCSTLATYYISKFVSMRSFFNEHFTLNGVIVLGLVIANLARYLSRGEPSPVYAALIMYVLFLIFVEGAKQ